MPRIIPVSDPSDLAEARGDLIPVGKYWDVLIEDVTLKQTGPGSKKPGSDYYLMRLRILDEGPAKNRTLFTNIGLYYEWRIALIQLNKSIGMPVTSEEGGGSLYAGDEEEYRGQHTAIEVNHEPDQNGEQKANCKRFLEQTKAAGGPLKATGRVPLKPPARRLAPVGAAPVAAAAQSTDGEAAEPKV